MSDEIELAKEAAKATQEVAKTASNVVDAGRQMGSFVSRFVSGPLEQVSGILEDKLRHIRWERQQRLIRRAEEYMRNQGLSSPNKPVLLKNAIPLLEYATLEEDDDLQDMWVRLLVNGTNESTGVTIERSFIEILAQLSPLEGKILQAIYSLNFAATQHVGVVTELLPLTACIAEEGAMKDYKEPARDVRIALANLARLGCVKFPLTWGGGEIFTHVNPTLIGREFYVACTERKS